MIQRFFGAACFTAVACNVQVHASVTAAFLVNPHHEHKETHHEKKFNKHAEHVDKPVQKHVEHGATPQHSGVNGDCPGNQSANSVAIGLMASVILTPLVVFMSMSKGAGGQVRDLTFQAIDMSTSIFLAVLWFSATDDVLAHETLHDLFPYAEEVFAILQVILLYVITMLVAYSFRDNKYYLLTFCGCAAHYVAFAGIKATGEAQHMFGKKLAPDGTEMYASLGFCIIVFGVFSLMSVICFFSWRRFVKNDRLQSAIEELELDIIGLVLSFAIMQALRHALTGHYPASAHLLLQSAGGSDCTHGPHHQHTAYQRGLMLLASVVLTLLAFLSLRFLEDCKRGYWMSKGIHVVQVVLVMCVAWGYLLWGEWQFYETLFSGDKMFGKMVFAVIATAASLLIIIILAYATNERFSSARGYAKIVIMAVSLVAAWSWEHCFHTAINVLADQYQVGYGGLVPKIVIALAVPVIILPGYIVFMKPIVVEVDERTNAEEHEHLHHHLSSVLRTRDPSPVEGEGEADASEPADPSSSKTEGDKIATGA